VNKTSDFKPTRLFYDLRQLLCYCETLGPLSTSPDIPENPEFYDSLHKRIKGFIKDGHEYIAKDTQIAISPLHSLNTHQYEFIDGDIAEQLKAQNKQSYRSSVDAIAGEYCAEHVAHNIGEYLKRRTALVDSLDEPHVKNIIQSDIRLTQIFQSQVDHMIDDNITAILVHFPPCKSHDSCLINKIAALTKENSLTKQISLDFSIR
tara:strand:+ start:136446 stop:137060 length:615 start_codon:yes stop_codon:yes gene_type:complete